MLGKTHSVIGITTAISYGYFMGKPTEILNLGILIIASYIGSLAPDVDHPNSTINNKFLFTRLFAFIFKHRGITHSALIGSMASLLAYFTLVNESNNDWVHWAWLGLSLGYASHLVADSLTPKGIPALYPLSNQAFQCPLVPFTIPTGSNKERLVFFLVLMYASVLIWLWVNGYTIEHAWPIIQLIVG